MLDISLLGVGLAVAAENIGDLAGQNLVVEVQPPIGSSIRLQLVGQVVNQRAAPDGRTRLGLQFTDLSESEAAVLQLMEQMRMFW